MALNTAIRLSVEERAWAYHLSMDRAETDYRNGIKYARLDGRKEGRKDAARRIVASGKLTPEEVAAILGLSPEEIDQLKASGTE